MIIVVTGGSASGKSAHAEDILCSYAKNKLYIATMKPFGKQAHERINRHRKLRSGKGFDTYECFQTLHNINLDKKYDGILIECMSNLLANEMFSEEKVKTNGVIAKILDWIYHICSLSRITVIVTSEVFTDGESYDIETQEYIRLLAELNKSLFNMCDIAYESVCGILVPIKGDISLCETL